MVDFVNLVLLEPLASFSPVTATTISFVAVEVTSKAATSVNSIGEGW